LAGCSVGFIFDMNQCLTTSHLLDCFLSHPTGFDIRDAKPANEESLGLVDEYDLYLSHRQEIILVKIKRSEAASKKRKSNEQSNKSLGGEGENSSGGTGNITIQ
jgi:hypothetical protein